MKKIVFFLIFLVSATGIVSAQPLNPTGYLVPVNQSPNFNWATHQVMPGESLAQIARRYYNNEDFTLLIADNPFLQYRALFNEAGKIVNYKIYPGELLNVRIFYGDNNWGSSTPPQPAISYPTEEAPVYKSDSVYGLSGGILWFMFGMIVLIVIVLSIIIGMMWHRRHDENTRRRDVFIHVEGGRSHSEALSDSRSGRS